MAKLEDFCAWVLAWLMMAALAVFVVAAVASGVYAGGEWLAREFEKERGADVR